MWDLIVSVPDHCLSFYFSFSLQILWFLAPSHVAFLGCVSKNQGPEVDLPTAQLFVPPS